MTSVYTPYVWDHLELLKLQLLLPLKVDHHEGAPWRVHTTPESLSESPVLPLERTSWP